MTRKFNLLRENLFEWIKNDIIAYKNYYKWLIKFGGISIVKINVGIGFVTGRKNFKNLLKSYVEDWNESGLVDNKKISLNLFIAYDLNYSKTKISDYNIIDKDILGMVDSIYYISKSAVLAEAQSLVHNKITSSKEAKLFFGEGYAMKRNTVLYFAIKSKMDYLIFLDDDEYPVASVKIGNSIMWKGQHVLATHINNIESANMTHGYHCGYISPIPSIEFNNTLTEADFKVFIEAISNDIISWDSVRARMKDGGITYADPEILNREHAVEVKEIGGMKFISGANLCFNLNSIHEVFPFYNPPGARGEDTFLSTCLKKYTVKKVPCYTFHDGFSNYKHILHGVLPNKLNPITADSTRIVNRFLTATIGWIRYKPLLLFITNRDNYEIEITKMKDNLSNVIPKICAYFGNNEFNKILNELELFHRDVKGHFEKFEQTKAAWVKIVSYLKKI